MPVQPILGIMPTGHDINGAQLFNPSRGGHYSIHGNLSDHGSSMFGSSLYLRGWCGWCGCRVIGKYDHFVFVFVR